MLVNVQPQGLVEQLFQDCASLSFNGNCCATLLRPVVQFVVYCIIKLSKSSLLLEPTNALLHFTTYSVFVIKMCETFEIFTKKTITLQSATVVYVM
jgi:hypothetical protein